LNRWDLVNGLLALTLVGLLALSWLPVLHAPPAVLLDVDPASIDEVRVERRDRLVLRLARDADGWRLTYPDSGTADPARVGQLLAVARAPVVQRITQPAGADYGLSPGSLVLQFGERRIAFGDRDPSARYRYVGVDGEVRVVDEAYYQLAGLPAGHYRAE
jgi:hypothetical protein